MTIDQSGGDAAFAWDEDVRSRVERRAQEIRRRRRSLTAVFAGAIVLVCVGIVAVAFAGSGRSRVRVATTGPDATADLARLLPAPSSVPDVVPQLHVKPLSSGRAYGVTTPAELAGAQGARFGVSRQWVSDPPNVVLQPGEQYPEKIQTVIANVVQFATAADARAWTSAGIARVANPVDVPIGAPSPSDLAVVRAPGRLPGVLDYVAVFTDGDTAFTLQMEAGGSGDHDEQFVRLVQDWIAVTASSPGPPTSEPR
jgi:hypothetical protein